MKLSAKKAVLVDTQSLQRFCDLIIQAWDMLNKTCSIMFMSGDWPDESWGTLTFFAFRNLDMKAGSTACGSMWRSGILLKNFPSLVVWKIMGMYCIFRHRGMPPALVGQALLHKPSVSFWMRCYKISTRAEPQLKPDVRFLPSNQDRPKQVWEAPPPNDVLPHVKAVVCRSFSLSLRRSRGLCSLLWAETIKSWYRAEEKRCKCVWMWMCTPMCLCGSAAVEPNE